MSSKFKGMVLAVDDDKNNLNILRFHLERDGYSVIPARDGVEGLDIIKKRYQEISLILLDRMMPNMNGIEFLRRVKGDKDLKKIPVILQTAAAEKNQVLEGIKAGAFHYLVKPFSQEVLLSVVRNCLYDANTQTILRDEVVKQKRTLGHIDRCELKFRTLTEAQEIAVFLANLYPDPDKVILGIAGLLENAVEYGNLSVNREQKREFEKYNNWSDEVARLQALPENVNKKVQVSYQHTDAEIILTIKDEGKGFDWKNYKITTESLNESHGKAIAIARGSCFDSVDYIGSGNEVVCKVFLNQKMSTQQPNANINSVPQSGVPIPNLATK